MKLNAQQRKLLKRAFRSISAGVHECDGLIDKSGDSEDATKLLALRVMQVTKLISDVGVAIEQSLTASQLLDNIEKKRGKPAPKAAKTRTPPHLRLVNGGQ